MEIRIHGRGGQGVVTMSKIIAEAASLEGYFSQSMPFYGAERRGAPVISFTRISDKPIYRMSQVYSPDILIVLDPILITLPEIFRGLKGGVAVLNSPDFVPVAKEVIFVDATLISVEHGMVSAGMPVPNIPMLGALLKTEIPVCYETLLEAVQKYFGDEERVTSSFREGYRKSQRRSGIPVKRDFEVRKAHKCDVPISLPSAGVSGKTGFWRVFRPVVDREKCNGCMNCWLHCPEGVVIEKEGKVEIDYDYCKGCMICSKVCPRGAIRRKSEMEVMQHAR